MEMLKDSVFFGVAISLLAYYAGMWLKKKFKLPIFNPLLISIIITIVVLLCTKMDYQVYYSGAKYISYLLTPATICLAIPLYEQVSLLKKQWKAVVGGIVTGVITSMLCIFAMCLIMGLGHTEYVTLLPKSITTAIGMGVSEELGGYGNNNSSCYYYYRCIWKYNR